LRGFHLGGQDRQPWRILFDMNFLLDEKEYKINPKKDQEKKKKKQN